VPSIPGCFSQGKTLDEAKKNIREAVIGWLEVMNEKARQLPSLEPYEVMV